MVTMAQSARKLAQHALTWIACIHSHSQSHMHLHQQSTLCEAAPAQLLQNLESNFYFEGTGGREGEQTGVPRENP